MPVPETLTLETCDAEVTGEDARRTETMGDLDPATWQTRCCPHFRNRLQPVFVGPG